MAVVVCCSTAALAFGAIAMGDGGVATGAEGDGGGGPRAESVDVSSPQATATGTTPDGGTVKVDLLSLRQRGDLAVLWVAYTYDGPATGSQGRVSPYQMGSNRAPAPELIDLRALRRHGVVKAGVSELASDPVYNTAVPGEPVAMYYTFAMPADGTEQVDVRIWEFVPAFEDVTVERES